MRNRTNTVTWPCLDDFLKIDTFSINDWSIIIDYRMTKLLKHEIILAWWYRSSCDSECDEESNKYVTWPCLDDFLRIDTFAISDWSIIIDDRLDKLIKREKFCYDNHFQLHSVFDKDSNMICYMTMFERLLKNRYIYRSAIDRLLIGINRSIGQLRSILQIITFCMHNEWSISESKRYVTRPYSDTF